VARIPKPTRLKILNGEPNQDRINKNEPIPPSGKVSMPAILKGAARHEWKRIYPILEKMQLISPADRSALTACCIAWGTVVECQNQLNKLRDAAVKAGKEPANAYLMKNDEKLIRNPLLTIRSQALAEYNTFAAKFGLTPSDRGKIEMPTDTREDELDDFLNTGRMN